jgi:hypothetical protein
MAKKSIKEELLKMLKSDMIKMKGDSKKDVFEGMMPKKMQKVTVMSDSPEGIKKGLSKAEEIMKAKLGDKKEHSCEECGKAPCECKE